LALQKEGGSVRTKLGVLTAALAIVVLGALTFGSAIATAHGKHKRVLRVVGIQNQFQPVDVGPPGPSLGDEFVFSETLRRHGREAGVSGVVCTATELTPPYDVTTFHCVATLSLRRGQITLQGLVEIQGAGDMGPFTVAITGGTGAYRGAGGEARIRDVSPTRTVYKLFLEGTSNKNHRT
jgi:hypothetical protein